MTIKKLTPLGRVPIGQPGFNFYQRIDDEGGYWVPTQKGIQIADEQKRMVREVEPPVWCKGGNYLLYMAEFEGDKKDHVVVSVHKGQPCAWLVQADEHFQGGGAKGLMPESFDWTLCVPWKSAQEAHRHMQKQAAMYPEVDWVVVARVGPIVETYGNASDLLDIVEGACKGN